MAGNSHVQCQLPAPSCRQHGGDNGEHDRSLAHPPNVQPSIDRLRHLHPARHHVCHVGLLATAAPCACGRVAVLLLVLWSGWMEFFGPRAEPGGWMRWIIPFAVLYLGFVGGVLLPLKSRRAFEQRKDLQRPCSFTASDAGLLFATEGTTSMKPWSDYLKWKEGDAVLLLYITCIRSSRSASSRRAPIWRHSGRCLARRSRTA